MRRRDLIAAGTVLAAAAATSAVAAPSSDAPPAAVTLNLVPLGLPVITEGRLRNYVFLNLRLHLETGQTAEAVRPHDPFIRDALVKAAHRVDFSAAGDWNRLNERVVIAATMAAARVVAGDGVMAGLSDAGLDVTTADLTIGTSAGSTTAAQIAAVPPTELFAATMAAARVVAGDGVIASVEVLNQAPRRRTGVRTN